MAVQGQERSDWELPPLHPLPIIAVVMDSVVTRDVKLPDTTLSAVYIRPFTVLNTSPSGWKAGTEWSCYKYFLLRAEHNLDMNIVIEIWSVVGV